VQVKVYVSSLWAVGWVLGVVVAYRLVRGRDAEVDAYLLLAAGLFFAFASGLGDVFTLGRSQVSTALPLVVARATVAGSLGLGVGLFAAALQRASKAGAIRSSGGTYQTCRLTPAGTTSATSPYLRAAASSPGRGERSRAIWLVLSWQCTVNHGQHYERVRSVGAHGAAGSPAPVRCQLGASALARGGRSAL
jgi:hypothetical protein